MNKTNWLIILCVLASVALWLIGDSQSQILEYLVFSGQNLLEGKVWTLITGLFLHADLTHLIGNMIFFYIFGNTIENELGDKWVLVPFFVGGVGSFIFSTLFYAPNLSMIGASAAIFTLTAIVMLLKPLKFYQEIFDQRNSDLCAIIRVLASDLQYLVCAKRILFLIISLQLSQINERA